MDEINLLRNLPKTLVILRNRKGYKQVQVAGYIDVSQSYYSDLEDNAEKITLLEITEVAKLYGMTVHDLLYFKHDDGEAASVTADSATSYSPARPRTHPEETNEEKIKAALAMVMDLTVILNELKKKK